MSGKLKLGPLLDERPVKVQVELSAEAHRMLQAYGEALAAQTQQPVDPIKLIGPMVVRFIASDRAFARRRGAKLP